MTYSIERRDIFSRVIGQPRQIEPNRGIRYFAREERFCVDSHIDVISPNTAVHVRIDPSEEVRTPYPKDKIKEAPGTSRWILRLRNVRSAWEILTREQIVWSEDPVDIPSTQTESTPSTNP